MIVLIIFLLLSLIANGLFGFLVVRASRRLLQFDEVFEYLVDDIETNVNYFEKLLHTPVMSDVQEIQDANKNMTVMNQRLDEYLRQMEDLTHRRLRQKTKERPPVKVGE